MKKNSYFASLPILGIFLLFLIGSPQSSLAGDCICGANDSCFDSPGAGIRDGHLCIVTDDSGNSVCADSCPISETELDRLNADAEHASEMQDCEEGRTHLRHLLNQKRDQLASCETVKANLQDNLSQTRQESATNLQNCRQRASQDLNNCAQQKREALADSLGLCMQIGNQKQDKIDQHCDKLSKAIGMLKIRLRSAQFENEDQRTSLREAVHSLEDSKKELCKAELIKLNLSPKVQEELKSVPKSALPTGVSEKIKPTLPSSIQKKPKKSTAWPPQH